MSEWSQEGSSTGDPSCFPWLSGDCGYGHYLAGADDGTWRRFFKRGAEGEALMITTVQPGFCCSGPAPLRCIHDGDIPWLLPALVRWTSPIDSSGHVLTDLLALDEEDQDLICFPPVIIRDAYMLDAQSGFETLSYQNLVLGTMADEIQALPTLGQFEGLAYPWQLVPLTKQAHDEIYVEMTAFMRSAQTWVLSEGNCWIAAEEYEDEDDPDLADDLPEPDQPGVYIGHGCHECGHRLGEPKCDCGRWATKEQLYISILDSPITGKDFIPTQYHPLWHYLQTRYVEGWQAVLDSSQAGDPWSTSCWQQRSPFSDGSSLEALRRTLSQDSTPSPGSSASSAA